MELEPIELQKIITIAVSNALLADKIERGEEKIYLSELKANEKYGSYLAKWERQELIKPTKGEGKNATKRYDKATLDLLYKISELYPYAPKSKLKNMLNKALTQRTELKKL